MIHEQKDHSLLAHNTFGVAAKAHLFIEYDAVEELKELLTQGRLIKPLLHVGGGSNLLFVADYPGTVLHSRIKGIERVKEDEHSVWLRVGAGVVWDDFVAYCVNQDLYGAENLSLIYGEVGASAVQNIGAYGVEAKDLIEQVDCVCVSDASDHSFLNSECAFAYRQSIFKTKDYRGKYIVTYVTYRLSKLPVYKLDYGTIRQELATCEACTLQRVREVIIRIRESKLPNPEIQGNAGSFFMNPIVPRTTLEALQAEYPNIPFYEVDEQTVKIPAGWMIDQCGWKGKALGTAAVHDKQALVLVNLGGATGKEIIALSDAVRHSVKETFGIDIHPEVNFIGGEQL